MEPSYFPIGLNVKSSFQHVVAQANLSTVNCPAGMVPIIRNSKPGQIVVRNIDHVRNKHIQHEVSFLFLFSEYSSYIGLLC